MTYIGDDFDGYIKLNANEMLKLKNGHKFLTVIRPTTKTHICLYGYPGDSLGATEKNSLHPQYNMKMVSRFLNNGKWIMVLARLSSNY